MKRDWRVDYGEGVQTRLLPKAEAVSLAKIFGGRACRVTPSRLVAVAWPAMVGTFLLILGSALTSALLVSLAGVVGFLAGVAG